MNISGIKNYPQEVDKVRIHTQTGFPHPTDVAVVMDPFTFWSVV